MSDIEIAVSEGLLQDVFNTIRDDFHPTFTKNYSHGWFSATFNAGVELQNGNFNLDSGEIKVTELDVVLNPLSMNLGIDIPQQCVGGFCIIWIPVLGCVVYAPEICIFSASPDISVNLDLSNLIRSELSASFKPKVVYKTNHPASMNYLDAENAGMANEWQIFLELLWTDIDLLDIPAIVCTIIENAILGAIGGLLDFLPDWARDIILGIIGWGLGLLEWLLDFADNLDEWLSDILNVSLGFGDFIIQLIANYFLNQTPLFKFEDPYPIMPQQGILIPVKIPVQNLAISVLSDELLLTADIG